MVSNHKKSYQGLSVSSEDMGTTIDLRTTKLNDVAIFKVVREGEQSSSVGKQPKKMNKALFDFVDNFRSLSVKKNVLPS